MAECPINNSRLYLDIRAHLANIQYHRQQITDQIETIAKLLPHTTVSHIVAMQYGTTTEAELRSMVKRELEQ